MPPCYGLSRKLSTIPVVVFVVGWTLYLVGFIKRMTNPSLLLPRSSNYTAIIAVGAGPLFVLFATLQACLGGTASAAMGSATAAAAVVFLVSLGNSSITAAQSLYDFNSTNSMSNASTGNSSSGQEDISLLYLTTTLTGSILCSLAVTVLLSLWAFYRDPVDAVVLHSGQHADRQQRVCKSPWFPGYAKRMAVPCLVLSFIGWGVLVGGHYHRVNTVPEEGFFADEAFVFTFGQWGACVLTPVLLLFGLIHAGARGSASAVMGVVNSILSGLTLTSIGYYLIHDVGDWLKNECVNKCDYTLPRTSAALCEIIGSFIAVFFWGSVVALWPFFKKSCSGESNEMGMVPPSGYTSRRRTNSRGYTDGDDTQTFDI